MTSNVDLKLQFLVVNPITNCNWLLFHLICTCGICVCSAPTDLWFLFDSVPFNVWLDYPSWLFKLSFVIRIDFTGSPLAYLLNLEFKHVLTVMITVSIQDASTPGASEFALHDVKDLHKNYSHGQILTMATEMIAVKAQICEVQTACDRLCRMHLANKPKKEEKVKKKAKRKLSPAGQSWGLCMLRYFSICVCFACDLFVCMTVSTKLFALLHAIFLGFRYWKMWECSSSFYIIVLHLDKFRPTLWWSSFFQVFLYFSFLFSVFSILWFCFSFFSDFQLR